MFLCIGADNKQIRAERTQSDHFIVATEIFELYKHKLDTVGIQASRGCLVLLGLRTINSFQNISAGHVINGTFNSYKNHHIRNVFEAKLQLDFSLVFFTFLVS